MHIVDIIFLHYLSAPFIIITVLFKLLAWPTSIVDNVGCDYIRTVRSPRPRIT